MRRREFISFLGGVTAWPLGARAQQAPMPVVGFMSARSAHNSVHLVAAFRQGLAEAGYVEGRNVAIEFRWAEDQNDRLVALAADLVRRQVTVIVADSTPGALTAKVATATIPIVFCMGSNAVEVGLVASLNRPGGNLTGVTTLSMEVGPKRLELLHEVVPTATVVALLVNPTSPNLAETTAKDLRAASPHPRAANPCPACEHRTRLRHSFCNLGPTAGRRARGRQRCILRQPERTAGRTGGSSCGAHDLPVSRVRRGRRLDELRRQLY